MVINGSANVGDLDVLIKDMFLLPFRRSIASSFLLSKFDKTWKWTAKAFNGIENAIIVFHHGPKSVSLRKYAEICIPIVNPLCMTCNASFVIEIKHFD